MSNEINPWASITPADKESNSLLDRQRKLLGFAEEIQLANYLKKPLRPELAAWLSVTLKKISFGEDAEECLGVKPDKPGQTKTQLLSEVQIKHTNGLIAALTDKNDPHAIKNEPAFEIAESLFGKKVSTIKNNWNSKDAGRGIKYTLSKK